jgi:mRNA interferase RelE/StbE
VGEYNVEFVASAAKEFRSLPAHLKHRIGSTVDSLSDNPYPAGVRKLHGHKGLYRIRVGQYRVVFEVDDQRKLVRVTQPKRSLSHAGGMAVLKAEGRSSNPTLWDDPQMKIFPLDRFFLIS